MADRRPVTSSPSAPAAVKISRGRVRAPNPGDTSGFSSADTKSVLYIGGVNSQTGIKQQMGAAVKISRGRVRAANSDDGFAEINMHTDKVNRRPAKVSTGTHNSRSNPPPSSITINLGAGANCTPPALMSPTSKAAAAKSNIMTNSAFTASSSAVPTKSTPSTSSLSKPSAAGSANQSTSNKPGDATAVNAPKKIIQEFTLRVPKTNVNPISLMRFNGALNVDISKWTNVKMVREDLTKHHKVSNAMVEDETPKFGAGSEYGREARDEARRRKYGGKKKEVVKEDQPWLLKLGDQINRKYRGIRDGGLTQNASYYVFTQAADGAFEVFPVQQWYNFNLIQRYKCLSAEEAEEEFGRRNKIMNYFSLMVKKRMQTDDDGEEAEKGNNKMAGKKTASSQLKVSEMDDWDDSDKEDDSDNEEKDDAGKKKKKPGVPKKKKKKDSDDEAFEDSDDGDGEGREMDYISDTSVTESEGEMDKKNDQKGVNEMSEESSSEEETKEVKEEEKKDEPGPSTKDNNVDVDQKDKKKKKKKKKSEKKSTSNSAAGVKVESDSKPSDDLDEVDQKMDSDSSGNHSDKSGDGTGELENYFSSGKLPSGSKRKAPSDNSGNSSNNFEKKPKLDISTTMVQSAAADGITEDAVRRYLARKPMTAAELLTKFKNKGAKLSITDLVNVIAHLLKKINPVKRMQNQKMYLFLSDK